jgi:poly-beta-hydroxyalkanoate depolymerase
VQPGIGHYGMVSGRKWETQIYPLLRNIVPSEVYEFYDPLYRA